MTASPSKSLACGFHDDVSIARGVLNWVYPDSLHVIGAISIAIPERELPHSSLQTAAPEPFASNYHAMLQALEGFAQALRSAPAGDSPLSFALVLVEPMLWTQFHVDQHETRMQVHVSGPRPDALVVVSGQQVIHEIAKGRLTMGRAYRLGLIRLYGPEPQMARFLLAYADVGRNRVGGPDRDQIRRRSDPFGLRQEQVR